MNRIPKSPDYIGKAEKLQHKSAKFFRISISVYLLLMILIIVSCVFVQYPVRLNARVMASSAYNENNMLKLYIAKDLKLKIGDEVILLTPRQKRDTVKIQTILFRKKNTEISVRLSATRKNDFQTASGIVTIIKHQKLFLVIVNRLKY